jgi:hypothetical protein
MKCVKCSAAATIHMANLDACRGCFQKIIQKRVRKVIRIGSLIETKDRVLIIDDRSAEAKLSIYYINEIVKDPSVSVDTKKKGYVLGEKIAGQYDKIVIPWSADMEGEYLLSCFLEKKELTYLSHFKIGKKQYIKPLMHVMHKEAAELCNLLKLKFSEKKKESPASVMIDRLQEEYPETAFGLVKSAQELKKFI